MSLRAQFGEAMARLGPFGAAPRLAIAVSGGADSSALALLARGWAAQNNGSVLALIVDHGLRPEAAAEAMVTAERLKSRGIESKILTITGLSGPAIQEKARAARHQVLAQAAPADGRLHLLLGHHAADQSETVTMRAARGPRGAEGIPAWAARTMILLLRPLLHIQPEALRDFLTAECMTWIEDPSNASPKFERVRIRRSGVFATPAESGQRQHEELETARFLARHATLRPEGFAIIDSPQAPPAALAALIRTVAGSTYPPRRANVENLAAKLRPATLGGVRITPAGRLGQGWLLAREPAACAPEIPAHQGVIWDSRFTLIDPPGPSQKFGALGGTAEKFRHYNNLPAIVLRTMPCLRAPDGNVTFPVRCQNTPPASVTSHPFFS